MKKILIVLLCLLGMTGMKLQAAGDVEDVQAYLQRINENNLQYVDTDGDQEMDAFTDHQIFLNPDLAESISIAELQELVDLPLALSGDEAVVYHTKLQDAVLDVRRQWVERKEVIRFGLRWDDYYSGLPGEIIDQVLEHTGVPTEGDYLARQYGSISSSADSVKVGNEWLINFTLQMGYYTSAAQEAEMNSRVAALMQSLNLSGKDDYTKAKAIYDYICSNVTYDYANLENDAHKLKYTAYAALVNKTSVCQGYATLFYRLALTAGLDCRYISGVTDDGGRHGWNIVKINGRYYNLDATWDAGRSWYNWFLRCTATFTNHNRNENYATGNFHLRYPMGIADYSLGVTETIAKSGTCGSNLTWVLDGNQVLTITGNGSMWDYADASPAPWSRLSIRKVVINEGITSIGSRAFAYHPELTEVILPTGLTVIGQEAFSGCSALGSVTLPAALAEIGAKAFYQCTAIKSLSVPGSVKVIGEKAFAKNTGITALVLGNGIGKIGTGAFMECTALQNVTYPVSVTDAAEGIFSGCEQLESVTFTGNGTIPNFTSDKKAPWNRSTIKNVVIENGITGIGEYAFYQAAGIQTVTIAESVKTIGHGAFYGASSLTGVNLPVSVETIGGYAFIYCTNLKSLKLPAGIQSVGEFAFYGCTAMETLTVPVSARNIASSAFNQCTSIKKLVVTGTGAMQDYEKAVNAPWYFVKSMQEVVIENGVTAIGKYAFYEMTSLTSVSIPESVKKIGHGAFYKASALTDVTIPESVETIDGYAFIYCTNLKSLKLPAGIQNVGEFAFYDCNNLETLVIPVTANNVVSSAFSECDNLKKVTITGTGAMQDYEKSTDAPWGRVDSMQEVVIESGVTSIGKMAFYNKDALVNVTIPETVTRIGEQAFAFCDVLANMDLPDSLQEIDKWAFYDCSKLVIKEKTGSVAGNYAVENKLNFKSTGLMTPAWKEVQNTAKGIKLSWSKITGASGYRIYRSSNGEWKKLADVKKGSKTSYVDTSVKSGTFYAYRICALEKGKIASDYSLTNANSVYLSVPKLTEVKNISKKKLQVKWKKVKGVGGYEIRYVTGKKTKTVQAKKSKVKLVLSGLAKKKTYKVSIRSYKKVNNVVWYSAWSSTKKVMIKK